MEKNNYYYKNPFYGDADFKQYYEQALKYYGTKQITFSDFMDFINLTREEY